MLNEIKTIIAGTTLAEWVEDIIGVICLCAICLGLLWASPALADTSAGTDNPEQWPAEWGELVDCDSAYEGPVCTLPGVAAVAEADDQLIPKLSPEQRAVERAVIEAVSYGS